MQNKKNNTPIIVGSHNVQLGRDLVLRKSEEKWGKGIVEQLSLDLQHEFPEVRGFSARNLWNMKKWYSFYALART